MGVKVRQKSGKKGWWIHINHKNQRRSIYVDNKSNALRIGRRIQERLILSEFDLKPRRKGVDIDYLVFLEMRDVVDTILSLKRAVKNKKGEEKNGH